MRSKFLYITFILWSGCLVGMDTMPTVVIPFRVGLGIRRLTCQYDGEQWSLQKECPYFNKLTAVERIERVVSQIPVTVLTPWQRMNTCQRGLHIICCPLAMLTNIFCTKSTKAGGSAQFIGIDFSDGAQAFKQYLDMPVGVKGTVRSFLTQPMIDTSDRQLAIGSERILLTPMLWRLIMFLRKDVDDDASSESAGSSDGEEEFC